MQNDNNDDVENHTGMFLMNVVEFTTTAQAHKETVSMGEGAQKIMNVPNAGGSSIWSEAMSFELLQQLHNAKLMRTEMELEYMFLGCKITDYSVQMFDRNVGVSVTRAMKFNGTFTDDDAKALLHKKLEGVNVSSRFIIEEHGWNMQILHVWAQAHYIAETLHRVWTQMDDEVKSNTLVMVTVCDAPWIYRNA